MAGRPHVVVIGAGFGGLRVVKGLRRSPVDVTVVDPNNFHTFQPLLYQVASGGLDAGDVSFPVRGILRRSKSARFVLGAVTAIDLDRRAVTVDDEISIGYDFLVIAAGSVSTSFGVAGVDEHALPLKTLHDAIRLRTRLLATFEHAGSEVAAGRPRPDLSIVIVGGGPTGVETAGGLRELVDRVLKRDFPELHLDGLPITLVEAAPRVLGPFHPKSSERAEETLARRGVHLITGVGVDHVEAGAVVLADGRRLTSAVTIWAAGVTGSPVASLLGVRLARGGRILVRPDLSLEGHPEVFAIGDIAASPTDDERPLPQVAQPAIQGGFHAAAQIMALVEGRPTEAFHYHDKGSMATIGRNQAVAEFPSGLRFHGRIGWLMWLGLHLVYLIGFRNRATVLVNWSWNYWTYDHSARTLVESTTPRNRSEPGGRRA
ncbi:MAG TPA: NAD(P)/FAD-dependent oxidoreductase [Ilumatobacter sp.]|nr:NAD(P)/FAD-dependent oxidoreductase [Ilumatobacter sp.]